MHTAGRPVYPNKPLPQDDLLCFQKIFGDGQLAEIETVTGWVINTRQFLVFLTNDKQTAWSTSLQAIISRGSSTYNDIETLVVHLNNCGYNMPLARHFFHPIQGIMRQIKISSKYIRYLQI